MTRDVELHGMKRSRGLESEYTLFDMSNDATCTEEYKQSRCAMNLQRYERNCQSLQES